MSSIKKPRPKKEAFLAAYAECGNVTLAAKHAEMERSSHYRWLREDEGYREAFDHAHAEACDHLEAAARKRAIEGWEEPVFYEGQQCGVKQRYSDACLIFLLKGNHPHKFGDKVEQTHKGDADNPVTIFELPSNGRETKPDA